MKMKFAFPHHESNNQLIHPIDLQNDLYTHNKICLYPASNLKKYLSERKNITAFLNQIYVVLSLFSKFSVKYRPSCTPCTPALRKPTVTHFFVIFPVGFISSTSRLNLELPYAPTANRLSFFHKLN